MQVLITGHCGFLGRHFYLAMLEAGHRVTGADIAGPVSVDAMDVFRYDRRRYDLVIHCAAESPHRAAIDGDSANVLSANLAMDAALFRWALRTRPGRVVYFSSSAAYPSHLQRGQSVPLREDQMVLLEDDTLGTPDAVYGWTKLTGEIMARHYAQAGGRVSVFRPFSGYGEDQSAKFPFGAFRDRALRKEDPFRIWGGGDQVRDFIHVDDIVGAVLAAVDAGVAGPVNLCTGVGTSMRQLATLFAQAAGYDPALIFDEEAPTGVNYRVGDSVRMRGFYQPKVTIEQGVARAVERGV